jgi:hypothetical protein
VLAFGTPALAQEQTREAVLAAQQAEKAKNLAPYTPSTAERRIELIQRAFAGQTSGPYPYFGSVYPGGGFAVGPGVRAPLGGALVFDAHAAWSIKNYKMVDVSLRTPALPGRRFGADLVANWTDAPTVAFHGVGNETQRTELTSFLYRATLAGVSGWVRPAGGLRLGGGGDVIGVDSGIAPRTAVAHNRFIRSRLFAEFDWRQSPGYTRRGGLYRVDWSGYDERRGAPLSFRRIDAEARQFVPLLRENWILAFRALASVTDTTDENGVPYFFLPDLGGSRHLRGYASWRFRDRNRLLLSGEYRWTAGHFVDMALFVDKGKVAAQRSDLDLTDLKTTYGIGVRFHAPAATVLRVELAKTREGVGLVFAFGESF